MGFGEFVSRRGDDEENDGGGGREEEGGGSARGGRGGGGKRGEDGGDGAEGGAHGAVPGGAGAHAQEFRGQRLRLRLLCRPHPLQASFKNNLEALCPAPLRSFVFIYIPVCLFASVVLPCLNGWNYVWM